MKLLRIPGAVFILLLSFLALSLSTSVPLAWAAVGTITEFPILPTAFSVPLGITLGPDGKMWFTENLANKIGRITPSGVITEFTGFSAASGPLGITAGPDGNLWFTEISGNKIGRVTPDGAFTEFPIPTANSRPAGIASGRGDKVWFTEALGNKIGLISTK